jgi:hypothetical protein
MACDNRKAARLLERSFLGELDAAGLRQLHDHLAGCEACRATYDRQVAVERRLEAGSGPLPTAHLDLLGEAVLARVKSVPAASPARWWRWLLPVPLAAAALFLLARPGDDGFQARAGAHKSLEGLRAFCIGQTSGEPRILAAVSLGAEGPLRCGSGDSLQFSYTTAEKPVHLAIVSLPETGGGPALIYTAGDATLAVAAGVVDEPLPFSTRLAARHPPGKRILFALFFLQPKSAGEIEATARALVRGDKTPPDLLSFVRSLLIVG